jgi:hypothetical protein
VKSVSAENRQFSIVPLDRDIDMMLGFEREQESLNARIEFHHTRRLD